MNRSELLAFHLSMEKWKVLGCNTLDRKLKNKHNELVYKNLSLYHKLFNPFKNVAKILLKASAKIIRNIRFCRVDLKVNIIEIERKEIYFTYCFIAYLLFSV